ncbi:FecCD family ABC transporter permease [Cohnella faecalis]|uniref:FecCD family ABC transporter permease n=1 Tax=Cohnella faecalis TaxID=2315694 RepID=UPI0036182953
MNTDTKTSFSFFAKLIVGLCALAAMFAVSMSVGAADVGVRDVWLAMTTHASGEHLTIIRELRFPREVAAIIVGAALAVSGAIMQGLTRNPLADPGLLGLTSGANAALAFSIAIIPSLGYFGITIACMIGATVGAALVIGIGAARRGGLSPLRMVLAGAAVSAFLYAVAEGIAIHFKISKDVSMWTAGGLIGTTWSQIQTIVPFIGIGILIALLLSRQLTILSVNEEAAVGLGLKTGRIKSLLYVTVILLAGASVALVGNLAFVGLMIPHIVRPLVGTDYRRVLPMTAVAGAAFMLLADTLARTIHAPYESPMAAIIAIAGLPFFLIIVRKGVDSSS